MPGVPVILADALVTVVESLLLVFVSLRLLGVEAERRKQVGAALLHALVVIAIFNTYKAMGWPQGSHTLLAILALALVYILVLRLRPAVALSCAVAGFFIIEIGSFLLTAGLILFHVDVAPFVASFPMYVLLFLLEHLPLVVLALVLSRRPLVLVPVDLVPRRGSRLLVLLNLFLADSFALLQFGVIAMASGQPVLKAVPLGMPDAVFWLGVTLLPALSLALVGELGRLAAAEARLNEAERLAAVGEMAATVAHEVRNPVTSVKGWMQLIRNMLRDSQAPREALLPAVEQALQDIHHLEGILGDFLALARPMNDPRQPVDVGRLLAEVATALEERATSQGVRIQVEPEPGLPTLPANPQRLRQVVENLLVNAIQSQPRDGIVRARVRGAGAGRSLLLEVADTGAGIPPEVQRKIFEPFFTTKESGTGLGLAVVRRIVMDHGGDIEVDSKPGKGSTFCVSLPCQSTPAGQAQAAAAKDRSR